MLAVNVSLKPNISFKVIHPLQQRRFRRISASAARVSKKVQLSRIGNRLRAFQRAIDEVRTLPLTPQRMVKQTNLSYKNRLLYIFLIYEASDLKYGKQLGFAKAHHQISLYENVGVALG